MHGLVVDSDVEVSCARQSDALANLTVVVGGARPVAPGMPEGEVLQSVSSPDTGLMFSTVRCADGSLLLRVHHYVDFEISSDLKTVTTWIDEKCPMAMVGIFIAGLLPSVLLTLGGSTVLHASAVEVGGRTLAFVADSGMGKSTLGALLCERGARLVTDDVLRLDLTGPAIRCWLGTVENRLRPQARDLAGQGAQQSVDGRVLFRPTPSDCSLSDMAAVVIPTPRRDIRSLEVRRLPGSEAVLALTRRPRIAGWVNAEQHRAMFLALTRLVAQVPVYDVAVPWGPPFDVTVAEELLRLAA